VLLLDEPLSALDKSLRVEMQVELKRIQRDVAITTLFVTHDQEEALTLSDRVGILNEGRLVQEGPPHEIYERPETAFTARFLGDANLFTAPGADGTAVTCAVRPEKMLLEAVDAASSGLEDANAITARVLRHIFAGSSLTYLVDWGGERLKVFVQNRTGEVVPEGAEVRLTWSPGDTVVVAP
jgi:ABC-type Fe3+/spermidine/putrescine transport system ATPase subunit